MRDSECYMLSYPVLLPFRYSRPFRPRSRERPCFINIYKLSEGSGKGRTCAGEGPQGPMFLSSRILGFAEMRAARRFFSGKTNCCTRKHSVESGKQSQLERSDFFHFGRYFIRYSYPTGEQLPNFAPNSFFCGLYRSRLDR